jgi:hypothetical protein
VSWRRGVAAAVGLLVFVYAASYADLVLRARSAYLEGRKYLEWNAHPDEKKAHFEAEFQARKKELESRRDAGTLSAADCDKQVELARFERDQAVAESSLKYAYVWFQTAADLFSPPESRWSRLARVEEAKTRELWKKELDAKGIPYKEYMLE